MKRTSSQSGRKPSDKKTLHRRAKERLDGEKADKDRSSAKKDMDVLVHELRLHQAELEMQNEELRRAQEETHDLQKKFIDLYDFAPIGLFTIDEKSIILEVNRAGADLLGVPKKSWLKPVSSFLLSRTISLFLIVFAKRYSQLKKNK